ncbi:hypothetical protein FisN_14Hh363 [Fistulifera solaris]|uniref:Uncharacterized protein n=1 Tax=Fistulifera solaris TaxID=1519565 RepID=A0A1Z5KC35_FISSO|nr:hypothetical protein FisN_14Hh363 [Fistulifera solaris]|eukprot:GAX23468.1 hypothetical protein FisN_14Hh363 [Fistulifera solaris]
MPPYGEPDWASPGNTSASNNMVTVDTGSSNNNNATGVSSGGRPEREKTKCWIAALSLLDLGLAAMMAALGLLSLIEMDFKELNDVTEAFLAIYMVVFAVLLAMYEFAWWQPVPSINKTFRKNFGFMYGLKGKGFYLIFIAFLCIGMWKDETTAVKGLDWATGLAWLGAGCGHVFLSCCVPNADTLYKPSTAGLEESQQENVV